MFTFYGSQEAHTLHCQPDRKGKNSNICFIAGCYFKPGTCCFTMIAFSHACFFDSVQSI